MEYRDNKYYLEITVLTPRREGMESTFPLPFKTWDETYGTDWKREPWQDNFTLADSKLYGNPPESVCLYHYDVSYHIKRYLLDRSKRWWNKVIRTVDANGIYHIKCKLPRLSKHSDLRDCEVIAYIANYVLPEDLPPHDLYKENK